MNSLNIKIYLIVFSLFFGGMASAQKKEKLPYQDSSTSPEIRAKDLLSRMSLEDKVYQLMSVKDGAPKLDRAFLNDSAKMREFFGKGVHSVQPNFTSMEETIESRNKIQKFLLEKTKWGIPAIVVDEGQHGLMKPGSTVFPAAIGLACSWDTNLFVEVYKTVAREMRTRGAQQALSPVIDVCRDPRWGRTDETYGEDPFLNGMLGVAAIRGFQGSSDGTITTDHVAATLKHFCGHGQSEGGLNQAPGNYSERVLREFHFPPFKMAVEMAKPASVMPSYNEIDGIPSHANNWLLKEVLRKEWGFEGTVVSDWRAIDQLENKHFVAKDKSPAAQMAFNAGVQIELPYRNYYLQLPELVRSGKINEAEMDDAVYKVLLFKFKLGLFENPYVDMKRAVEVSKDPKSKELALKSAHESIVLLKNENNLLPLSTNKFKKIAVIGPCASDMFMGGYSGEPYQKVSLLQGIQNKVGKMAEVTFARGCKIVENLGTSKDNWQTEKIVFPSREENLKLIAEAVEVAKKAEVVILAVGETEHISREAWSKEHIGDNMTLDLIGEQEELVKAVVATGKPVVVWLMNGRPLSVNYVAQNVPAIIEGWYMGQETGIAAANILFGDVNPSGKLTITIPKSVGQLPMYYNHKPSARFQNYISSDVLPLYAFGHGLSYTTFSYSNLKLSSEKIKTTSSTEVSVDVTNSGKVEGDEIVQLYIRDKVSSVTRPVKELKDFERITLKPGETKTVKFTVTPDKLSFWNVDMKQVVEPGEFEIIVGKSSVEFITTNLFVE